MNDETLLLRQIHPIFVQKNRPSSQAFRPTPKDEQKLSVYDGDQIDAFDAWNHYTNQLRLQSFGVMAVTVSECHRLDLPTFPDPTPFQEHALIDFSAHSKNIVEKKAKELRAKAELRGWLYQDNR